MNSESFWERVIGWLKEACKWTDQDEQDAETVAQELTKETAGLAPEAKAKRWEEVLVNRLGDIAESFRLKKEVDDALRRAKKDQDP